MLGATPQQLRQALEGVRIIDFTHWVVGPLAPRLLAHFGAQVIKIERTDAYDGMRQVVFTDELPSTPNQGGAFNNMNADKLAITVNTRHPEGLRLVERLIGMGDAVIENFSAGVMESWGLGYERMKEISPKILYVSMSGFGHTGPLKEYRSYGPTAQAVSGLTLTSGLPGMAPAGWGYSYMDIMGGFMGALALTWGLYRTKTTGRATYIDYAIIEAAMTLLGPYFLDYEVNGRGTRRPDFPPGNRSIWPPVAPHNTYRCFGKDRADQDQWCFVACETQGQFEALCALMGQEALVADPRFVTNEARVQNQDALDAIIAEWTAPRSKHDIMDACQAVGVIGAAVQNAEEKVDWDPQLRHRQVFPVLPHPETGMTKYEGYPVKLSRTPARLRRGAPLWREHNRQVFGEILGLSGEEIARLEADGVI